MLVKLQSAISLFTCGCLVSVAASPSSIGIVVTSGQAQVDGSLVRGNSTLFQGSLVRAGEATSDLMLPRGSNLLLQPGSAASVYRDHAVLRNGVAVQRGNSGYALIADGLTVSSLSAQGAVFVDMQDHLHLKIAAQGGPAEVRTASGDLVARLEPGKALAFAVQVPQQGPQTTPTVPQPVPSPGASGQASPPVGTQLTLHGTLRKDHAGRYGHYLLTDLPANITYELQGPGLDDFVGAVVEATGSIFDSPPAEGASRVLSVSDIHQITRAEVTGGAPAPSNPSPATAPPTPSAETVPPNAGAEGGAVPATPSAPAAAPSVQPLPVHSDTAKILVIVAIAAGAVVGVALGLGGGKSSTVSPG